MSTAAKILNVMGNKYRYQIIEELKTGEKNVSELNKMVRVSQPALSQHLAKLRRAGIIGGRRDARQIFYSIKDANVLRIAGIANEMGSAVA